MKISYNWLKQYADIGLSAEELAKVLTNCGLEVESLERFESVKGGLEGVVIGEVLECEKHPNADKLSVTRVDAGQKGILAIVCGASNVAKGQKVPVATIGTILYMGDKSFEIRETRIRGELSQGMICAEDELGLGTSHEGIMVLDPSAIPGTSAKEYFNISEDHVFEIGLTPNRTDATSHIGVARDVIAVLNKDQEAKRCLKWPDVSAFKPDDHNLAIAVEVEAPELCPRYSGVTLTGVTVKESPSWLKNYLTAAGVRPINNVVDITNFVLLEVGQPLHAFDANAIRGKKVIVRRAHKGEKFTTLDDVERSLVSDDLMICNETEGMCIAGVFGGVGSGVTGSTTDIFLESAHFDPRSVRKTSRTHGLQTDASFRFERGTDPEITTWALKRAALLIRELAGGRISSEIVDVYPKPSGPKIVGIRYRNVARLIGKEIPATTVVSILQDLGIRIIKEIADGLMLEVPAFKVDVTREADVIEEILRIYGYDNVEMPGALRSALSFSPKPDPENIRRLISDALSSNGFSEIMNNSLTRAKYAETSSWLDPGQSVRILNPLSNDLNVMRQTLLYGCLETVVFNQNRKAPDLKLFELGRIYYLGGEMRDEKSDPLSRYHETEHLALVISGRKERESWRKHESQADFFDLKQVVNNVLLRLGISLSDLVGQVRRTEPFSEGLEYLHKAAPLVGMGIISRKLLKEFDIRQDVLYAEFDWEAVLGLVKDIKLKYKDINRFPEVRRDLALVIDRSVTFEELENTAFSVEKKLLQRVGLFDIYEDDKLGDNKKSYALSFILQDSERTLTDAVIDKTMEKLVKAFKENFDATLR